MTENSKHITNPQLWLGKRIQVTKIDRTNTDIIKDDCGIIVDIFDDDSQRQCVKVRWNRYSNSMLYTDTDHFIQNELNHDKNLHSRLVKIGREVETGIEHNLEPKMINGILATLDYFGLDESQIHLLIFDLCVAKYKIFDWLGMWYMGRYESPGQDMPTKKAIFDAVEKLVILYTSMKDVGGWAWSIRGHIDLAIEDNQEIYHRCKDCIQSYQIWHNMSDKERARQDKSVRDFFGKNIIQC
jgi:hypothetical protein